MSRQKTAIRPDGYSYTELQALLDVTLDAGLSALMRGHPGVGKSTLAAELAEKRNLELIDIRLAQRDPAELAGVYFPNHNENCLALYAPDWVKRACERPGLVFLDEINAAVTRLHQAAAYQIVLEHRVGPFVFHPNTVVLAAGNLDEDNAIVAQLSSALCNRFVHYSLRVDADCWLAWARENQIDEAFIAYISRHGKEALYRNDGQDAFPSPRSWAMAAKLYARTPRSLQKRAVAACVGPAAAKAFYSFQRVFQRVNAESIIARGQCLDFTTGKNSEPSFMHAAVFSVAAWLRREAKIADEYLGNIVRFISSPGLDPEYWFLFLRQLKGHPDLLHRLKCVPEYRAVVAGIVDVHVGLYQ
ncbi:MAG: AAA family ATPase [Myxococcota bacterium]|nr:AAA family ATPase [Myxococcota bacterium]